MFSDENSASPFRSISGNNWHWLYECYCPDKLVILKLAFFHLTRSENLSPLAVSHSLPEKALVHVSIGKDEAAKTMYREVVLPLFDLRLNFTFSQVVGLIQKLALVDLFRSVDLSTNCIRVELFRNLTWKGASFEVHAFSDRERSIES